MKDSQGVMVNRHARNALGQYILIKVKKKRKEKNTNALSNTARI